MNYMRRSTHRRPFSMHITWIIPIILTTTINWSEEIFPLPVKANSSRMETQDQGLALRGSYSTLIFRPILQGWKVPFILGRVKWIFPMYDAWTIKFFLDIFHRTNTDIWLFLLKTSKIHNKERLIVVRMYGRPPLPQSQVPIFYCPNFLSQINITGGNISGVRKSVQVSRSVEEGVVVVGSRGGISTGTRKCVKIRIAD